MQQVNASNFWPIQLGMFQIENCPQMFGSFYGNCGKKIKKELFKNGFKNETYKNAKTWEKSAWRNNTLKYAMHILQIAN